MYRIIKHIIVSCCLFTASRETMAQIAMPDTVCVGTTRRYQVNDAATPSTYTWKIDGVTQFSAVNTLDVTWNTAGTFLISVVEHSNTGCDGDERAGTVVVLPLPVANAGPDIVVCYGEQQQLHGSGGVLYQWTPPLYLSDPGIANPKITTAAPGVYIYALSVANAAGCKSTKADTVKVTILPQAKVFAGRDTSVVINQPVQLNAVDVSNSGFVSYIWSPGFGLSNAQIRNPVAVLNSAITYRLTATDAFGCKATDDISIKVFERADIYVPTAFTPNGDGLNDVIKAIPVGMLQFKYFKIYNRWGEMVFSTTDAGRGWDGIYKGEKQSTFTFVWIAAGIDFSGKLVEKRGTVTLIR